MKSSGYLFPRILECGYLNENRWGMNTFFEALFYPLLNKSAILITIRLSKSTKKASSKIEKFSS